LSIQPLPHGRGSGAARVSKRFLNIEVENVI